MMAVCWIVMMAVMKFVQRAGEMAAHWVERIAVMKVGKMVG
jgi:hypothetical protein